MNHLPHVEAALRTIVPAILAHGEIVVLAGYSLNESRWRYAEGRRIDLRLQEFASGEFIPDPTARAEYRRVLCALDGATRICQPTSAWVEGGEFIAIPDQWAALPIELCA